MKIAIVGGGLLGLTLAHRLAPLGHTVELLEAAPALGGLAAAHDFGPFVWDRFYHCILPTDGALLGLLGELDLDGQLRWAQTGTGYWGGGRMHPMSGNLDFLRFPLLDPVAKARLAATVIYAGRIADPWPLYRITAAEWLTRLCGRRGYEIFWRPLLRAKFGAYHDRVAAVFIWATLTRLFGARSQGTAKEKLGYVSGGYGRILGRFAERLTAQGVSLHTGARVTAITPAGRGCAVAVDGRDGATTRVYDQLLFTGPTHLAAEVAQGSFAGVVARTMADYPTASAYLGVACLVLVLRRPLTRWYVLNVGDESLELTGVIEMTNLIDPAVETAGLSLVYVPLYMGSDDPRFHQSDEAITQGLVSRGLRRLFPDLDESDFVYARVHRARYVQPLPLAQPEARGRLLFPSLERPFQLLNTSMLACATLNNNEVVGLVDRWVEVHGRALVS